MRGIDPLTQQIYEGLRLSICIERYEALIQTYHTTLVSFTVSYRDKYEASRLIKVK